MESVIDHATILHEFLVKRSLILAGALAAH